MKTYKTSIVTLHLNENGKKALNAETKVLYIEKPTNEITEEEVDKVFPIFLVDGYEVMESFLDLEIGDYVILIDKEGNEHLGKVADIYGKQRIVTTDDQLNDGHYPIAYQYFYFNPDGVEATRTKKKMYIKKISAEELEAFLSATKKQPLVDILNLLNTGSISFDPKAIEIPEWLDSKNLLKIKKILQDAHDNVIDDEDDESIYLDEQ